VSSIGGDFKQLDWFDQNDLSNGFGSIGAKTLENLPTGGTTYGFWEYISYLDDLIYTSWVTAADFNSMGLCGGLILTAVATKTVFMPAQLYGQIIGYKMRLLQPDTDQTMATIKRY
jgi:hypothetical protein